MQTKALLTTILLNLCLPIVVVAQPDGDHTTSNVVGQTFLAPDANVLDGMGNPVPPVNMTIGTAGSGGATLRVRGDQLPVNDAFAGSCCTFRNDVQGGIAQNWSMVQGQDNGHLSVMSGTTEVE